MNKHNFSLLELLLVGWLFIWGCIASVVSYVSLIIVAGLITAWPAYWLWNHVLITLVTGINPITSVWQAWGLMILCGLLFRSRGKQ